MKKYLVILCLLLAAVSGCSSQKAENNGGNGSRPHKILIAYYSQTGTTAAAAEEIQKQTGGTLFQIKTNIVYPKNAPGTLAQVKQEYIQNLRPHLSGDVENFADYDTVFLGFPNWFDAPPMGVFTFLEGYDWKGKTIYPFVTYGLSGFGSSIGDIQKAAPAAAVGEGLMLHASIARKADKQIAAWLQSLHTTEKEVPKNEIGN